MFNAVKLIPASTAMTTRPLRDILFSWWEERFLQAHAGAPAIEA